MDITLKHPFTNAAGQRIETLTVRRPKRGDMKAAAKYSKDEGEQEDFLFARITGLVLEDIDLLDLADSAVLQDSFRAMVGEGRSAQVDGRGAADRVANAAI
jgi:hypothetical protein